MANSKIFRTFATQFKNNTNPHMSESNYDIFISYKRKDKEKVFKLKEYIEKNVGVHCWIDLDGIESDAQFANVIMNAIDNSSIFLFMHSHAHSKINDITKDWTVRELNYAQTTEKRIVFINIDKTPLPKYFIFMFPQKQQVDASSKEAMYKLCCDIRVWLHKAPPSPPPNDNRLVLLKKRAEVYISKTKESWKTFFKLITKWIHSKNRIIVWALGCCTILVLGWIYVPHIFHNFYNGEIRAWYKAKDTHTINGYISFIDNYPNGRFIANAKREVVSFRQADENREGVALVLQ